MFFIFVFLQTQIFVTTECSGSVACIFHYVDCSSFSTSNIPHLPLTHGRDGDDVVLLNGDEDDDDYPPAPLISLICSSTTTMVMMMVVMDVLMRQ